MSATHHRTTSAAEHNLPPVVQHRLDTKRERRAIVQRKLVPVADFIAKYLSRRYKLPIEQVKALMQQTRARVRAENEARDYIQTTSAHRKQTDPHTIN